MKRVTECRKAGVLGALLSLGLATAVPALADNPSSGQPTAVEAPAQQPQATLPLRELRKFTEVFARIKDAYVEEVSDKELLENAIKGMLSGLDPHSAYLEPQAYEELEESTSGEFGGLGIEVGMEDGFVKVIAPIDDTPAQRAGVMAGDLIIKLGDEPVKGMSLQDAISKMRGEPGTILTLTIMRDGESAPLEIEVERAVIRVTSIRTEVLEPGYVYVRITQFQEETGKQFKDAISRLREEQGPLRGMIIDVRNNPGGVLQAAVETTDAILDEGLIVYTEGRIQSSRLRFSATPGDITDGTPIVVLINGGSASASEILAGALQDHERAVIMGTRSFGKGSVQSVIPLDERAAIKMTTARYYTPEGRSIQARGIRPDIEVRPATLTEQGGGPLYSEASLSGHLRNGHEDEEQEQADGPTRSIERDYQLRSALNLLKGIRILGHRGTTNP